METSFVESSSPGEFHPQALSWDRNWAHSTLRRELPFVPFRAKWVPSSSLAYVSQRPPCHPGRSDFPSPVGDHSISPIDLPSIVEI